MNDDTSSDVNRFALFDNDLVSRLWWGASWGAVVGAVVVSALAGAFFQSGLGLGVDAALGGIVGAVAAGLFAGVTLLVLALVRLLPTYYVAALGGAIGALFVAYHVNFYLPAPLFYPGLFLFVWVEALLAGSFWVMASGGLNDVSLGARVIVVGILVVAIGMNGGAILWLANDGDSPMRAQVSSPPERAVPSLDVGNPGEKGDYSVRHAVYGSGDDVQRSEYGSEVDFKTEPVNGSRILPEWQGFTAEMRDWYWGFGIDEWPINGRVWMPDGDGPFPLVLVVHGNHSMEHYSDPGYAYLGELLASRGFVTVSVDENFINGSWSGDFGGAEIPARAWLLLKHLERWRSWNETEGHPFYQQIDMENIALVGHSRGGEAVSLAARFNALPAFPDDANQSFDFGFSIKSLIAFAPTDYRYERRPHLQNVNYLTLQGSYDIDERSFFGIRQFQRVSFTNDFEGFKAGLYIHRANHGQFNSEWGSEDFGPPTSWLLNTGPLIDGADQRQIAKVYVSGFLEATLLGRDEYRPLFRNHHAASDWLPRTTFLHRFKSPDFRPVATYEEDIDVATASIPGSAIEARRFSDWQERDLPFRGERTQQNNAVILEWEGPGEGESPVSRDSAARYTITLPDETSDWVEREAEALVFSLARLKQETGGESTEDSVSSIGEGGMGLYVQVADGDDISARVPLRGYASIPPVLHTQYLKLKSLSGRYGASWEPILQTYEIPLSDFVRETSGLDVSDLQSLSFVADRRQGGRIALDNVGVRLAE